MGSVNPLKWKEWKDLEGLSHAIPISQCLCTAAATDASATEAVGTGEILPAYLVAANWAPHPVTPELDVHRAGTLYEALSAI